ncbi:MAG: protein jag [Firmicutes bacterium]|nr:protein jag [Bacillota bacterium]
MKEIETTGKTIEEATEKALKLLQLPQEEVVVEVITEASSGLFGLIGTKPARIRVTEAIIPEKYMVGFLDGIITKMGLSGDIAVEKTEQTLKMNVNGAKMGMLIGKRGQTLNALQYLVSIAFHKRFPGQNARLILDVEGYREKREETLRTLALNIAQKAVRTKREVMLEPMNPQERRIIHTTLQDNPDINTYSQGDDPYRKVVIAPK